MADNKYTADLRTDQSRQRYFCEQFHQQLALLGVESRMGPAYYGPRVYLQAPPGIKCFFTAKEIGLYVDDRGQSEASVKLAGAEFQNTRAYIIAADLHQKMLAQFYEKSRL